MAPRTVSATWSEGYRCEVQTGRFTLVVDEPVSSGGTDEGPQPTEVFLASVASCFTLSVSHAAQKRSIELEHLRVDVTGTYDGPKFVKIDIRVDVGCAPEQVDVLLRSAERVCYVTNTIRTSPPIEVVAADL